MIQAKRKSKLLHALLLLCLCAMVSCSEKDGTSDTPSETTQNIENVQLETEPAVEDKSVKDNLPDIDLDGKTLTFLVRQEQQHEFIGEQSGNLLSDVIYERHINVSERFNCSLEYVASPGEWATQSEYQQKISQSVLADDKAYDIVTGQSNIVMPLAKQNMYHDISNSKYIDFTKPYWKSGYTDNVKINGKLFTLCGDYALTTLTKSTVLFFNKNLYVDYNIEMPYEMIRNGKWTFDELIKIANIGNDLNGDGTMNDDDLFGFAASHLYFNPLMVGCGVETMKINQDGRRELDFPTEKSIDIATRAYDIAHLPTVMLPNEDNDTVLFAGNHCLMLGTTLDDVEKLRDMDSDFGILPYPKYDEAQENYRTFILRRFTISAIPSNLSDEEVDAASLILEAFACEGYNKVVPAYYEVALKEKYARDTDTAEMLDIITSTVWFDFADAYYPDFGALTDFNSMFVQKPSNDPMSHFKSMEKELRNNLEKLYKAFEE